MKSPLLSPPNQHETYLQWCGYFIILLSITFLFCIFNQKEASESEVGVRGIHGQQYINCLAFEFGSNKPAEKCPLCKTASFQQPCAGNTIFSKEFGLFLYGRCSSEGGCYPSANTITPATEEGLYADVDAKFPDQPENPVFDLRCEGGAMSPADAWAILDSFQRQCLYNPQPHMRSASARKEALRFIKACGAHLHPPLRSKQRHGLWAGDMALSLFATKQGSLTFESSPLGSILSNKLEFTKWKDHCMTDLWEPLNLAFIEGISSEIVEVYLNSYRHSSALISKFIPYIMQGARGVGEGLQQMLKLTSNSKIKQFHFYVINDNCRSPYDDLLRREEWFRIFGSHDCWEMGTFACFKDADLNRCIAQSLCSNPRYRYEGFYVDLRPLGEQHGEASPESQDSIASMRLFKPQEGNKPYMIKGPSYDLVWDRFCRDPTLGGGERVPRPPFPMTHSNARLRRSQGTGSESSESVESPPRRSRQNSGIQGQNDMLTGILDCFKMGTCFRPPME